MDVYMVVKKVELMVALLAVEKAALLAVEKVG